MCVMYIIINMFVVQVAGLISINDFHFDVRDITNPQLPPEDFQQQLYVFYDIIL